MSERQKADTLERRGHSMEALRRWRKILRCGLDGNYPVVILGERMRVARDDVFLLLNEELFGTPESKKKSQGIDKNSL